MKIRIYPKINLIKNNKNFNVFDSLAYIFNELIDSYNEKVTTVLNFKALVSTKEDKSKIESIDQQLLKIESETSKILKESMTEGINDILETAEKYNILQLEVKKDLQQFKAIANILLEEDIF